ncbi:MAG: septation protein SpoVG [Spirochaetes bacterium GWF1_41_5]|nr:MAG: septation protein SpoVG [Spirochaetes bacterium GWF1_41_5]HBE03254.1 transcriptional regulator [Spirochaetia bacterium]
MQITDIRVKKVDGEGKLKGYASVTFDNEFVVHNIKIISGNEGHFIAMPSRKTAKGEFKDVAHPISTEFRNTMQKAVIEAFNNLAV